jgi:hypothetical protein
MDASLSVCGVLHMPCVLRRTLRLLAVLLIDIDRHHGSLQPLCIVLITTARTTISYMVVRVPPPWRVRVEYWIVIFSRACVGWGGGRGFMEIFNSIPTHPIVGYRGVSIVSRTFLNRYTENL